MSMKSEVMYAGERELLAGENLQLTESQIGFLSCVGKVLGTLYITNYRLYFESDDKNCLLNVPLGVINRIDKVGYSNMSRGEDSYGIEVTCKDIRILRFSNRQENHSRRPLFECLQKYAFPLSNKLMLFSFESKERFPVNGWDVYNLISEFGRMGIPNQNWRITTINTDYRFSETYPAYVDDFSHVVCEVVCKTFFSVQLCVPVTASDDDLVKVASFRSRARIPNKINTSGMKIMQSCLTAVAWVCCWLHPDGNAALTRSAQPSVGVTARRNHDDEQYLQKIIDVNGKSKKLYIMDARPVVNARVNKAKGGGYESEVAYPNAELVFLNIENIHVMRESMRKLRDLCAPRADYKNWFTNLDETRWLEHIRLILCGAARIVDKIENHATSVLVHCSDGWDRTSQLTSLAMLMLDPYYRTLKGFEVLIEKEWCSFGHKFAQRVGHGDDKHSDPERSPVFLQFIDCVYQLTMQFPTSFEFNMQLLITILDHLYSCRFGTFLFNNEKQRVEAAVKEKTNSLWSFINSSAALYMNPAYILNSHLLLPCCSARRMKFWSEYYLRWNPADNSLQRMKQMQEFYKQMVSIRRAVSEQLDEIRRKKLQKQTTVYSEDLFPESEDDALTTLRVEKVQLFRKFNKTKKFFRYTYSSVPKTPHGQNIAPCTKTTVTQR
ncbi:Myotubularin-related protein 2 [Trichinella patagoniensis]|uniref:phosphatidylinositol-3,5-bisphosphate 3-phosphatase n=1 Tax=Trichinella patagoniensis TaxID=990121 RepID=A0A0V1AE28_9BILA|nr:Myotubularin-related protein 2 [Trichinella patagoniensis]